ncbi:hypothetical protein BKA62DRAFT_144966 [Auriculariales sp. MPI-PUGE-AT-0066]|nr:hypothetical protein BKA62DRAFT_144966 [Auriculariales sp. MPI-PUGE-AT-0066]
MATKPAVLICGGLNTFSRAIAEYLVPKEGDALVSALRVVDKYSVVPATTYVGHSFPELLKKDVVTYQQVNLTVPANITKVFEPAPGAEPFSIVFDCTGDITFDRADEHQAVHTAALAYAIGKEAARRNVAAYIRLQPPYYECTADKTDKGAHTEADNLKPEGVRGQWFHETLRLLAGIKELNLAIVRVGSVYGPRTLCAEVTTCLILGAVYKKDNEELKFLYPGNRINTVHTDDVAAGSFAIAQWLSKVGRAEADKLAGEEIHYAMDKSKPTEIAGEPGPKEKVVAPMFNLVDDTDATQGGIAAVVAEIFSIKTGSFNPLIGALAKMSITDVATQANEEHSQTWMQLITEADPPIGYTPLTAYLDPHLFGKRSISYSGAKLKKLTSYQLRRPTLTKQNVAEVLESYKADGIWPNSA